MAFAAYLIAGLMLLVAYSTADVTFTEGQFEFLALIGYLGPTIAVGLVWIGNYRFGAPLLTGAAGVTCWFVLYFFFLHDNPATVWAVEGDGASAYTYSSVALVITSIAATGVGCWLWYRESEQFRTAVDTVVRPGDGTD